MSEFCFSPGEASGQGVLCDCLVEPGKVNVIVNAEDAEEHYQSEWSVDVNSSLHLIVADWADVHGNPICCVVLELDVLGVNVVIDASWATPATLGWTAGSAVSVWARPIDTAEAIVRAEDFFHEDSMEDPFTREEGSCVDVIEDSSVSVLSVSFE